MNSEHMVDPKYKYLPSSSDESEPIISSWNFRSPREFVPISSAPQSSELMKISSKSSMIPIASCIKSLDTRHFPRRRYYCGQRKRKFTDFARKSSTMKDSSISSVAIQSTHSPIDSVAARKLHYEPMSKKNKLLSTASLSSDNIIINLNTLQSIFSEMSVCNVCLSGKLEVIDTGAKCGSAIYLLLKCSKCMHPNIIGL